MARPKGSGKKNKNLGESKATFVEDNILLENPVGLPDHAGLVMAKTVPEMRRIAFINNRDPGYPLEFHYHSKTHPLKHYKLMHGHEYTLPVEIIEHLEGCAENQYGYRTGADGLPEHFVKARKFIFQCRTPRAMAA